MRSTTYLTLACLAAAACVESPAPVGAPHAVTDAGAVMHSPQQIGYGDGAVPQVHLPLRPSPPPVLNEPVPLTDQIALTVLPEGGALLAWSTAMPGPRPTSRVTLRTIAPDATLGPILEIGHARGTIRGISVAARTQDALVTWNTEYGGRASQLSAQRLRHDGTLLGGMFGLGTFRVMPFQFDAGADRLGFFIAVTTTASNYVAAVRGPMVDCHQDLCVPLRVVDIDDWNAVRGLGGIDDLHPSRPVVLLGDAHTEWSLLATFRSNEARPSLAAFGTGPLRALVGYDGAQLEAAWVDASGPHAIVTPTVNRRGLGWGVIVDGRGGDASTFVTEEIVRAATVCRNGTAAVAIRGARSEHVVAASALGGDTVFAWALAHASPHNAPAAQAFAPIAAGLVAAGPSGLGLARCTGDRLGPLEPAGAPAPHDR